MKKYLCMELYRGIWSKRFLLIVLLITAILFGSISEYIVSIFRYGVSSHAAGVTDKLMEILIFDRYKALIVLLLSALYSYTVSDDISTRFGQTVLEKISIEIYTIVKTIANLIITLTALMLAFLLFAVIGMFFWGMPLCSYPPRFAYYSAIMEICPFLYIPFAAILFGLFSAAMSIMGMLITAIYPGRYLAYAFPFGFFYILLSLTGMLPRELIIFYICSGVQVLEIDGFFLNYGYGIGFFTCMIILADIGFKYVIQRRFNNGRF